MRSRSIVRNSCTGSITRESRRAAPGAGGSGRRSDSRTAITGGPPAEWRAPLARSARLLVGHSRSAPCPPASSATSGANVTSIPVCLVPLPLVPRDDRDSLSSEGRRGGPHSTRRASTFTSYRLRSVDGERMRRACCDTCECDEDCDPVDCPDAGAAGGSKNVEERRPSEERRECECGDLISDDGMVSQSSDECRECTDERRECECGSGECRECSDERRECECE